VVVGVHFEVFLYLSSVLDHENLAYVGMIVVGVERTPLELWECRVLEEE
jgi:hypothetical protein